MMMLIRLTLLCITILVVSLVTFDSFTGAWPISLPPGKSFSLGEAAIVAIGLYLGNSGTQGGVVYGFVVAGAGASIADFFIGQPSYMPISFLVNGLACSIYVVAGRVRGFQRILVLTVGGTLLVGGYYIGETIHPSIGIVRALSEVNLNIVQVCLGTILGYMFFSALKIISEETTLRT